MNTLYIVRGVSGSGKTTYAKELAQAEKCLYFEADMWFDIDGVYTFNASELGRAHEWCFEEVADEISHGRDVIVSNTFTRSWEMEAYIAKALNHGYRVRIITCTGRYQNTHGLTEAMVARQVARFQSNKEIEALYRATYRHAYTDGNIIFSNH